LVSETENREAMAVGPCRTAVADFKRRSIRILILLGADPVAVGVVIAVVVVVAAIVAVGSDCGGPEGCCAISRTAIAPAR
jgi:hypothetical protein